MSKSPDQDYKVVYSKLITRRVKLLADLARHMGMGGEFLEALQFIFQKLNKTPRDWGDPLYRLRAMELDVFHGVREPLHVHYAVDERRKLAYILTFDALPHHPLNQDP